MLDPRSRAPSATSALAKLRKAQTRHGAFPWFPGGPPSPYMTLYLLHGFAKAAEFDVDVPQRHGAARLAVPRAGTTASDWRTGMAQGRLLLGVASPSSTTSPRLSRRRRGRARSPPTSAQQMLDFSFKHWKQHSPLPEGLPGADAQARRARRRREAGLRQRDGLGQDRRQDEGTFWAPEDRSWLWYNDTIETHAFALRALMELASEGRATRRPGAVAAPQQEAQPVEVDARHRRGHLLAGQVPQSRASARRARRGARSTVAGR